MPLGKELKKAFHKTQREVARVVAQADISDKLTKEATKVVNRENDKLNPVQASSINSSPSPVAPPPAPSIVPPAVPSSSSTPTPSTPQVTEDFIARWQNEVEEDSESVSGKGKSVVSYGSDDDTSKVKSVSGYSSSSLLLLQQNQQLQKRVEELESQVKKIKELSVEQDGSSSSEQPQPGILRFRLTPL